MSKNSLFTFTTSVGRGGPYQQIKVYSRGQELKWNRIEHRQLGIGPLLDQIYVILVKKTQREVTQYNIILYIDWQFYF